VAVISIEDPYQSAGVDLRRPAIFDATAAPHFGFRASCLSMIFSENRVSLFRIML
jgi:hypothetical protein